MKFRNEIMELGMRFYKFETDEDYRILSLVKLNNNDTAIFMDEETFELHTINKNELDNEYTLFSDSLPFAIAGFDMPLGDVSHILLLFNEYIKNWLVNHHAEFGIVFRVYRYMRKAVFDKTVNYILKLNNLYQPLSEDLDTIWRMYFSYMSSRRAYVMQISQYDNIDMEEVVNNNAKLPDSVFDKAEKYLNTYILSYEVYEFDDSVNIDNVNMKYFLIYDEDKDKYFIVLYVIDTTRVAVESMQAMKENIDIVQFMLG